jgi:hypothetical protein
VYPVKDTSDSAQDAFLVSRNDSVLLPTESRLPCASFGKNSVAWHAHLFVSAFTTVRVSFYGLFRIFGAVIALRLGQTPSTSCDGQRFLIKGVSDRFCHPTLCYKHPRSSAPGSSSRREALRVPHGFRIREDRGIERFHAARSASSIVQAHDREYSSRA